MRRARRVGLALSLVALNLLDVWSTHRAFGKGASEANPVADLFIHNQWLAYGMKGAIAALIGVLVYKAESVKADFYVTLVLVVYMLVVLSNLATG